MVAIQDILTSEPCRRRVEFLKGSEHWPREQFLAYQLKELKDLLAYCQSNIPYYQELFRKEKIDVAAFKDLSDLKRIPFLTKKDIQGRYEEFIPSGVNIQSLHHRSTGGSTGTPLTVYYDDEFLAKDKANTLYYMDIGGYDPLHYRSLRIYGDKVPEECVAKDEFWYEQGKKLVMSCYHFSSENCPKYIKKINEHRPDYIHSRPSALLPLADYMVTHGVRLSVPLGAVFFDGEFLNEAQRERIEEAFQCRVYNIYGHTEACTVGVSCKESRLMHFMPQVGILELLDDSGRDVTQEDGQGEMVVTGFNNRMFPLIRYRTFDIGVHTNQTCTCGRAYRMIKRLDGRVQDFVVNRSSVAVPLAPAVFNYNDMDWKGIKQFQVYQDTVGKLTLKIVRENSVEETPEKMAGRIKGAFDRIFNKTFELQVEYVDDIPRTRIGKYRYLNQKLDMNNFFARP